MQSPVRVRSALCSHPVGLALELVQSTQISLGRSHHNVRVRANTIDHPATVLQADRHLALALGARAVGIGRPYAYGAALAGTDGIVHVLRSMLAEAFLIGVTGTFFGVIIGYFLSWLLQEYGFNVGEMMKDSTILMPTVLRARITPATFYIGFIPGIISTVIGNLLAGIGIYKRETANLFKELES